MPRASKIKLDKEKLKEIQEHFSFLISSLNDSNEIESFFDSFLTEEEKIMLTKRLVLFMMIKRGYPTNVIQSALNMSYETIRIYVEKLMSKNELFHKIIEKLIKRGKTKEFWEKLDRLFKPFEVILEAKTNMRARAKLMTPGENWPE